MLMQAESVLLLAETVPRHTQRLYQLGDRAEFPASLYSRWVEAEEAIYQDATDPLTNWDSKDLQAAAESAGLRATVTLEPTQTELLITSALLDRWFNPGGQRPSYADRLKLFLTAAEIATLQQTLQRYRDRSVVWQGAIAYLHATIE